MIATALLLPCFLVSEAKSPKTKKAEIPSGPGISYLDLNFKTWDRIQKAIHAFAEPGYLEYKSSKILADELEKNGFSIEWGVADIPTAFVATYGSGAPVIGLLGEYDALPRMSQDTVAFEKPVKEGAAGHACGHNLLGSATAAGAIAISKWLAEGHKGTVKYFGCPAEEGGGGKAYMTKAGCFKGCDAVFDSHPGATNVVNLSAGLANIRVRFTFSGIASHAAGAPWKGRSALDGVESFNYMMNMMREHLTPETRIHYAITEGGRAPNVVPAKAVCEYYIRHPRAEEVLSIFERAKKAAEGAAMGTGTTVSWEIINGAYERMPNKRLSEIIHKNFLTIGGLKLDDREREFCVELQKSTGMKNPEDLSAMTEVVPTVIPPKSGGGSSDVGNVAQVVPVATLRYAATVSGCGSHSWQWVATVGTTIGTKAAINAAKVFYLSALDLYNNPEAIREIWEEYYSKRGHDYKFIPLMGDRKPPLDYCKE